MSRTERKPQQGKGRSQSWQPPDGYFESLPQQLDTNVDGTSHELGYLERCHKEVLLDNFRLWECINVLRCNPRLLAPHVMRRVYALSDEEFRRIHQTYQFFEGSGSGALSSTAEGGGRYRPDKYPDHMQTHLNGLVSENERLLLCLDLISRNPERSADEVVCHSFGLSDENFGRHYPSAVRGSSLRSSLRKLRDESEARPRSHSLPASLSSFAFPRAEPRQQSDDTGPSCSNNNEAITRRVRSRHLSPFGSSSTRVDPFHHDHLRSGHLGLSASSSMDKYGAKSREAMAAAAVATAAATAASTAAAAAAAAAARIRRKQALRDPPWVRLDDTEEDDRSEGPRRLKTKRGPLLVTGRPPSPVPSLTGRSLSPVSCASGVSGMARRRSTSPSFSSSKRTRAGSPDANPVSLPYMVSHYPYNWATSNNSSIHRTESPYGDEEHEVELLPEGDFDRQRMRSDGGAPRRPDPEPRVSMSARLSKLSEALSKNEGSSRISYSSRPASFAWFPSRKASAGKEDSVEPRASSMESGDSMFTPRNTPRSPVARSGGSSILRKGSPSKSTKTATKRNENRNSPQCVSPRKKPSFSGACSPSKGPFDSVRSSTPSATARSANSLEKKNVTFKQQSPRKTSLKGGRGYQPHTGTHSEKPLPMYYKPPAEKGDNLSSEGDSEDDEDVDAYAPLRGHNHYHPEENRRDADLRLRDFSPAAATVAMEDVRAREEVPTRTRRGVVRSLSEDFSRSSLDSPGLDRSRYELLRLRDDLRSSFRETSHNAELGQRPPDNGVYSPDSLDGWSPQERSAYTPPPHTYRDYDPTPEKREKCVVSPAKTTTFKSTSSVYKERYEPLLEQLGSRVSPPTISPWRQSIHKYGPQPFKPRPSSGPAYQADHGVLYPGPRRAGSPKNTSPTIATARKTPLQLLQPTGKAVQLSDRKEHRAPMRRALSPELNGSRTEDWLRIINSPGPASQPPYPRSSPCHPREGIVNESRHPDSRPSRLQERDQPFLERLMDLPNGACDSVADKLLQERRQLEQKYSKPHPSPVQTALDNFPGETRHSARRPSSDERYARDHVAEYELYARGYGSAAETPPGNSSDAGFGQTCGGLSLREESQNYENRNANRPTSEREEAVYEHAYARERGEAGGGYSSAHSSAVTDQTLGGGAATDATERLRLGAEKLREQTEKSRLRRQRRGGSCRDQDAGLLKEALTSAYDNLGVSQLACPDKRNRHHSQNAKKNKNCNALATKPASPAPQPLASRFPSSSSSSTSFPSSSFLIGRQKESSAGAISDSTRARLKELAVTAESAWRELHDAPAAVLGEVAFQLERRIITQVFRDAGEGRSRGNDDKPKRRIGNEGGGSEDISNIDNKNRRDERLDDCCRRGAGFSGGGGNDSRHRFYGFTVLGLAHKIRCYSRDAHTGRRDAVLEAHLLQRYQKVIAFLRESFGYHVHKHGKLCQDLINRHGLFGQPPDVATVARLGLDDFRSLRNHVIKLSNPQERPDLLVLVDCLHALGRKQGNPILSFC